MPSRSASCKLLIPMAWRTAEIQPLAGRSAAPAVGHWASEASSCLISSQLMSARVGINMKV